MTISFQVIVKTWPGDLLIHHVRAGSGTEDLYRRVGRGGLLETGRGGAGGRSGRYVVAVVAQQPVAGRLRGSRIGRADGPVVVQHRLAAAGIRHGPGEA